MRLGSQLSQYEVFVSLNRAASEAWGTERAAELSNQLKAAARQVWTLLQHPLPPMGEEPDHPIDNEDEGEGRHASL